MTQLVDMNEEGGQLRQWAKMLALLDVQADLEYYCSYFDGNPELSELQKHLQSALLLLSVHTARLRGAHVSRDNGAWVLTPLPPF